MHSFTSNFRQLPHGWRSLAIATLFALAGIGGLEAVWRARGVKPSIEDDDELWCRARTRVGPESIVIVGSSRVQTGIDPEVLSNELHRPVVQLAVAGMNPVPSLLELARDASFHGVVILEYMPRRLLTADLAATDRIETFIASCSNPSLVAGVESRLDEELQSRFSFMQQEVQLMSLLSYIGHHRTLPRGSHTTLRTDRYAQITFHTGDTSEPDSWDPVLPAPALDIRLGQLHEAVASIRARGGRVVLYRAPVAGAVLQDEEGRYPASQWFLHTATMLDVDHLDFSDLPELRDIHLQDGEHPDSSIVPAMTEAFGRELERKLGKP